MDGSNLQGQDWNFLSSSRGNTQTWLLMSLNVIAHPHFSYLPNSLPNPSGIRPILSSPRGWESTAKLPCSEEGLSQEAEPAFVYQRSDYVVGCYLSLGDGCRVSSMTALTPVGDVWSGIERHGLAEVLGSYRTQCDLNSHWIPWGIKDHSSEVETKPRGSYCYFCVCKRSPRTCWSALLQCFWWTVLHFRTSISEYWLMASTQSYKDQRCISATIIWWPWPFFRTCFLFEKWMWQILMAQKALIILSASGLFLIFYPPIWQFNVQCYYGERVFL